MMTDQQRQQGFLEAIRAAEFAYGLTLQAQVNEVKDLAELALELHNEKQNGNGSHVAPLVINQQAENDLP